MTRRTRKVGIAGKYGARYGVRARKRLTDVEGAKAEKYPCPRCLNQTVKRTSTGIWKCRKCELVFAGGAYVPQITAGITREDLITEEDKAQETGGEEEEDQQKD